MDPRSLRIVAEALVALRGLSRPPTFCVEGWGGRSEPSAQPLPGARSQEPASATLDWIRASGLSVIMKKLTAMSLLVSSCLLLSPLVSSSTSEVQIWLLA